MWDSVKNYGNILFPAKSHPPFHSKLFQPLRRNRNPRKNASKKAPAISDKRLCKIPPYFFPIPCLQKWYALSAFQTPQPLNRSHSSIPENTVNFLIRRRQNHIFQHAGRICILNPRHYSRHRRNNDQCPGSITSPEFLIHLSL